MNANFSFNDIFNNQDPTSWQRKTPRERNITKRPSNHEKRGSPRQLQQQILASPNITGRTLGELQDKIKQLAGEVQTAHNPPGSPHRSLSAHAAAMDTLVKLKELGTQVKNERKSQASPPLSPALLNLQKEILSEMKEELSSRAEEISSKIKQFPDHIQKAWTDAVLPWQAEIDQIQDSDLAAAHRRKLDKLKKNIADLCLSDIKADIQQSYDHVTSELEKTYDDSVTTKERLANINALRASALKNRRDAWKILMTQSIEMGPDLDLIAVLGKAAETEHQKDQGLITLLNREQHGGTVGSMLLYATGEQLSKAASYFVPTIRQLWSGTPSPFVQEMEDFDKIALEYMKAAASSENAEEITNILIHCRNQKVRDIAKKIENAHSSALNSTEAHSSILTRSQNILTIVSGQPETSADLTELSKAWEAHRNLASVELKNLAVLQRLAKLYSRYKDLAEEAEDSVNAMTGVQKEQGQRFLNNLYTALDPAHHLEGSEVVHENLIGSYERLLVEAHTGVKDQMEIESKKNELRREIKKQIAAFTQKAEEYRDHIDEIEDTYGIHLTQDRRTIDAKLSEMEKWNEEGTLPHAYHWRFMPNISVQYAEASRAFIQKSYVGSSLPTQLTDALSSIATIGFPLGAAAGAAAMAAPWAMGGQTPAWDNLWPAAGAAAIVPAGVVIAQSVFPKTYSATAKLEDLGIEELPLYLARVASEVEIKKADLEYATGVQNAYDLHMNYLEASVEAEEVAATVEHYPAWKLEKGVREADGSKDKVLQGEISAKTVAYALKDTTKRINILTDDARLESGTSADHLLTFDNEVKKLRSQVELLDRQSLTSQEDQSKLQQAKSALQKGERHLMGAKEAVINMVSEKARNHKSALNNLLRPLENYPAVHKRITQHLNENATSTAAQIPEPTFKNHLASILPNSTDRTTQTYADRENMRTALSAMSPKAIVSYKKSVDSLIAQNAEHVTRYAEDAKKATRAQQYYDNTMYKATDECRRLDARNQIYTKAKLEEQIERGKSAIDDIKNKKVSGPWVNIPLITNIEQPVYAALRTHAQAFGRANSQLTKAIEEAKSASISNLTIPEQVDLLHTDPVGDTDSLIKILGKRFEEESKETIEATKRRLEQTKYALSDVIGRFYIRSNSTLATRVDTLISNLEDAISKLEATHVRTNPFIDLVFSRTGLTRKSINELNATEMRNHQKNLAGLDRKIDDLEREYPILGVLQSHQAFENAITDAKRLSEDCKRQGKFHHAINLDHRIEEIIEQRRDECNLKARNNPSELRAIHANLRGYLKTLRGFVDEIYREVDRERRDNVSLSYSRQLGTLMTMPDSRMRDKNIEALKAKAAETIRTMMEEHADKLDRFQSTIEEIDREFGLPADLVSRVQRAVERESSLITEHRQTFTVDWLYGLTTTSKTLNQLNVQETADAADKLEEICRQSFKNVYSPAGLHDINLKHLETAYKRYQEAAKLYDGARVKLKTDKQYLYLSEMEQAYGKAVEDLKLVDVKNPRDLPHFVTVMQQKTQDILKAQRKALHDPVLTLAQQAEKIDPASPQAAALCQSISEEFQKTIRDKRAEIDKFKESVERMEIGLGLPRAWVETIESEMEEVNDSYKEAVKGFSVLENGWFGPTHRVKPMDALSLSDISKIERNLDGIWTTYTDMLSTYDLKTLSSQYETFERRIKDAQDTEARYRSNYQFEHAKKIGEVIARVKSELAQTIDRAAADVPAAMKALSATVQRKTNELLTEIDKIQRTKPATFASRLRAAAVGSVEYNECKKELKKYAERELKHLQGIVEKYEKRLDTVQNELQAVTGVSLSATWLNSARQLIHDKLQLIDTLQTQIKVALNDEFTPYDELETDGLAYYEATINQLLGTELSTIRQTEKPKAYAHYSAMGHLESTLKLEALEKDIHIVKSDLKVLKDLIERTKQRNTHIELQITLESLEGSANKLLSRAMQHMDNVYAIENLKDTLKMAHATISRVYQDVSRNIGVTVDPWAQMFNPHTVPNVIEQQTQLIEEEGFDIPYKEKERGPSGYSEEVDRTYEGMGISQIRDKYKDRLTNIQRDIEGLLAKDDPLNPIRHPYWDKLKRYVGDVGRIATLKSQIDQVFNNKTNTTDPEEPEHKEFNRLLDLKTRVCNVGLQCVGEAESVYNELTRDFMALKMAGINNPPLGLPI